MAEVGKVLCAYSTQTKCSLQVAGVLGDQATEAGFQFLVETLCLAIRLRVVA